MIRQGYPRIREKFGKLSGYVQLIRPFTLFAPFIAGVIGVITPVQGVAFEHIKLGIYAGATLALAQACGQVINQYADADLDKLIKPYRPIPSELVGREEALGVGVFLALLSASRGFLLGEFFGSVIVTLLFFAIFYSLAPFSPRKIHPYLNIMWMAVSRGFLPVLAVYNVNGNLIDGLVYSALAFLWVLGFQATKDLGDVEGDRAFGIKTLATEYGASGLYMHAEICLVVFGLVSWYFQLFHMMPMGIVGILAIVLGSKQSAVTENNYGWTLFYLGLALFYVLMFVGVQGLF